MEMRQFSMAASQMWNFNNSSDAGDGLEVFDRRLIKSNMLILGQSAASVTFIRHLV